MTRQDPIFDLPGPLLFAHRGGAKEVPESTPLAFEHAQHAGADVLELDVNLTADREVVVWHGPGLENVRLSCEDDLIKKRRRNRIDEFRWSELADRAWVADYQEEPHTDLSGVPTKLERRILLLADMLSLFPDDPINIELKGSLGETDIAQLVEILDKSPRTDRRILIVSADHGNLKRLERWLENLPPPSQRRYALGCSALQVVSSAINAWLPFVAAGKMGRALQTTYWRPLCTRRLVEQVHDKAGAVHVFITPFGPIPGLDETQNALRKKAVIDVLARGVDGIMTDRPSEVRPVIDAWLGGSSRERTSIDEVTA
jgi:glycerophosphoryl diester phosphodiesterase